MLRKLTRDDVEIRVTCSPDDANPDDSFAYDDAALQKEVVDEIREKAEHNEWAWCVVEVAVSWERHSASAYLGACSYASKEDFVENSGYYADMVGSALEQLNREVAVTYEMLKRLEVTHG